MYMNAKLVPEKVIVVVVSLCEYNMGLPITDIQGLDKLNKLNKLKANNKNTVNEYGDNIVDDDVDMSDVYKLKRLNINI